MRGWSNDPTAPQGVEPPALRPRLLVFWPGGVAERDLTPGVKLVIGRGEECQLHVLHASVSRAHLEVSAGPPALVKDLGSSNGSRLQGKKLDAGRAVALTAGSVVEFGEARLLLEAARGAAGERSTMAQVRKLVEVVAPSMLSVLIQGETGSGKELLAAAIHQGSPRAQRPYVKVSCAALTPSLLESELFGYEKGAFTGATEARQGLVEAADGGTLFLDEVGEMSLETQAKLLRVLDNREVRRVGAVQARQVDVRFVAATNRSLAAEVAAGRFRQDLYFRLNGICLELPPLRERTDEILPIARDLLAKSKAELSKAAGEVLLAHRWPGNIRELKNVVERAAVVAAGAAIGPEHLMLGEVTAAPSAGSLKDAVAGAEKQRIVAALEQAGGNQGKAAELLGISRRTLINRLEEHGLPRPRKG